MVFFDRKNQYDLHPYHDKGGMLWKVIQLLTIKSEIRGS